MQTMMMERTVGTAGMMPGMNMPAMPTMGGMNANMMMIPTCKITMEKCDGGMKMMCDCETEMAAKTLQSLCTMMAGAMCSCCMMMNGMMATCCNMMMATCKCEMTDMGCMIMCTSGDAECCKMIQACCDCMMTMMEAGCSCCVMMNNMPICCGC